MHVLRSSIVMLVLAVVPAAPAAAQEDAFRFLAGAAIGFGLHEAGHLTGDLAFGASPGIREVSFGPVPFFAITHTAVSPAREFTISAAGFWSQQLSTEIVFLAKPRLREARAPMLKGMLAFHVAASAVYSAAAFARTGPDERDTRGMAAAARLGEPVIGAVVLVPAAFDTLRYFFPEQGWLRWASRAAKAGGVLLVARAAR